MFSTRDPIEWMWAEAQRSLDDAERAHRQFFRLTASSRAQATWEPPVDAFEDEREIVLVVALPGVAADRIVMLSEPGALVIRAERGVPFSGSRQRVRQLEIPYGVFERRITLPDIPLATEAPELTHGCLVVRLRKIG
ncbi:MAG TPA: Hsp20/alpha crystallin family protein [Casimicrobiaceae bacterium]|nr:Hsp20/alpha crystallin family protein [Casimicrobiaceae bacterium]